MAVEDEDGQGQPETRQPQAGAVPGILQPAEESAFDDANGTTRSFSYKGVYEGLLSYAEKLPFGATMPGDSSLAIKSWRVAREKGGLGVLTLACVPSWGYESGEGGTDGSVTTAEAPMKDIWSVHAVRQDRSIMAYCGPSVGANPSRCDIELWLKEPDAKLAVAYNYRAQDGSVVELSGPSRALAMKFEKGVESVMRFYVSVTRKRVYAGAPPECLEKIGFIDQPPAPESDADKKNPSDGTGGSSGQGAATTAAATKRKVAPKTLKQRLGDYQFLKCQDDVDEQADGTWARTESWIGILKSDANNGNPWDADLYGEKRWAMPADLSKLT